MKLTKIFLTSAVAAIAFGAGIANAAPDVVILKVAHFLPSSSNVNQHVIMPWCEKINRESGGKLKCQIYPSMQMGGTPGQLFDQVRDGVADIIWTAPSYQAGRFSKSEVFELPFMVKKGETASPAVWEFIQKNSLDEFKGAKLIFTHTTDGSPLHFGKKSVKSLEDFKGLKFRTPTRLAARTVTALGGVPVQMPPPSVPESIAKAVVDGASFPWGDASALKLQEICKTHTEPGSGRASLNNTFLVFAMNQAKYNNLPPELKKVIDQNSGVEASRWAGKVMDSFVPAGRKLAQDRHNTINILSEAEFKRWEKATEPVVDDWIKEVGTKGANGRVLVDNARAILKKYRD